VLPRDAELGIAVSVRAAAIPVAAALQSVDYGTPAVALRSTICEQRDLTGRHRGVVTQSGVFKQPRPTSRGHYLCVQESAIDALQWIVGIDAVRIDL
jgi:hypothetical protein